METEWIDTENGKISRREFVHKACLLGMLPLFSWCGSTDPDHISDEIFPQAIVNAQAFYENQWKTISIGIRNDASMFISETPIQAQTIFDAKQKIISSGFIDILADNTLSPETTWLTFEKYKLTDGCTTALQMHGGSDQTALYYQKFGAKAHYINYGVSTFVMVLRNKYPNLATRLSLVEKNLEEGALGVSHSIEYQPTDYAELLAYAKLAAKYQRPYFLHLRHSGEHTELNGVKEAIQLAKTSGAHVHIDHLHSTGGTYHMAEALQLIKQAIQEGIKLTCCVYPFSFWATYLPSRRFDPGWQERYKLSYQDLTVVGTGEKLNAQSFAKYRQGFNRLVAVPEGTMDLAKTVDLALQEDFCMIGSDGGIETEPRANNHPRGASCFATALRHALDIRMPIEKMIEKMTTLPARLVGKPMDKRGELKNNHIADLVLINPDTVKGIATVENPNQFSQGIEAVWVNGKISYQANQLKGSYGKGIRW